MGGLTHTNGDINCCKWLQAVDAWMQFEVDLILFSEMQPSIVTSDTPAGLYTLDYNPEHTRKPGRGTGAAIHRSILESCTKLHIPGAPSQSGFWIIHLPHTSLIVGAWYGPVKGNNRSAAACINYWTAWSKSLWTVRRQHPTALIVAGGDANVVLESFHPIKKQDTVASEFVALILHQHDLQLANLACPRRTHKVNAFDLLVHSPNIVVSDFEVHDGLECSCGKSYCGPIAGSDHAFVTATLDILRPVEHLLEPCGKWNKTTDWNAAMKRFAPHFTLLATWITTISTTVACEDRNQSQALIGCLCYV